jgi:CheY-specific phosphatase CheX
LQTTLIIPLLNSLRRVCVKMVGSDAVIGRPTVMRAWREEPHWVVAVVAVTGAETGAFAIYMPNETADAVARELDDALELSAELSTREVAVRELARMVVNLARRDRRIGGVTLSKPTVRTTGPIGEMPQKLRPWVSIPVTTSLGNIVVGLSLNTRGAATSADANQVVADVL